MLDLIIIGGGPGGLSSAIYGLRAKLDILLIEKIGLGGQIAKTDIKSQILWSTRLKLQVEKNFLRIIPFIAGYYLPVEG